MSETLQSVYDLPDVSFIDNDTLDEMRTRMVSRYEEEYERLTGTKVSLSKADPNRIMLYAVALELYQIEQYVDRAGKQDLLKYSYGDFLDNLGAGRAVFRNGAAPATTTLRFTLSETRPSAIGIPQGTLATNGDVYFATDEYAEVAIGETYVDVTATCTENGVGGNELLAGQIDTMVDLIAYVETVENITETSGGSDIESDEDFAERIFLAPSSYSVAGPDDAYKYWALSYSSSIGDVMVTSPTPVYVEVYILMADGSLPTETMLAGLEEYLMDGNIRPLTDKVSVLAPDTVEFDIGLTYYINRSDQNKAATIQGLVAEAVEEYVTWQTCTIGRDINPSELVKRVVAAGAKRVELDAPAFTAIPDASVARVGNQSVTYGGIEDD
ncbi:MAG: baseplate J/gp47 family protein [Clostridia bacterium]|nr:baseplate J/gp47 family protein [Clostridia bacterium]